ncbi:Amino acid adenylation domain protein [Candidatus Accumulibacter aalborgensis]|uniref:Amino acid adenylation domain protein n=1 Tax=Candidatus Accumulibacter aalborgensis TaxID=1860102 RepID=A0A1A8XMS1_9PROT|nr:amino acid adenylation domain-containing protein [Candidatus Accumulibacter aalborgensis]SBT06455.1 Amino acid adenylation domain protein [Candidatus Accumulibacter aalborgensis]
MSINYNLACAVHRHSLATPDAIAVVYKDRSVSYREMAERAASLAECLTRRANWQRQDGTPPRVGILASRGIDACVALLGACWAGATYVPLSLKLPEERLLTLLSLCRLSAIIADQEGAKLLSRRVLGACPSLVIHAAHELDAPPDSQVELVDIESLPATEAGEPQPMEANDTAYIIFTSGTTGVPKGVMIPTRSIRHYLEVITPLLDLRASDRALEPCELSFDFSVHNMFSTWQAGASLHILPATVVMNAVKFARQSRLTVWNSVPSLVGMLRQVKALSPGILPDLRVTVFGGEQLPAGTVAAWQTTATNSAVYNLYGPTEVTVFCLGQAITRPIPLTPGRDFVAVGTPLPGSEAMVVSENGEVVADGATGELLVAGAQIAEGYLDAPDLTAARFPMLDGQRWYRTGDLAMRDDGGTFHCLGRIDNQVKVLGYRVELEEVDAHLRIVSHADVVGSVAWPSLDGMARGLVSFVGGQTIDSDQIIADLKARLPAYMVPSRLIALEHMPLNASGKVDRRALLQLLDQESP